MNKNIYKKDDKLIIEIPLLADRWNPYSDSVVGTMPNIIGVIEQVKNSTEPEMGFAYRIDMSYKGKDDQWTDFFFKWFDDQKSFKKLCKDLGIDIVYS